MSNVSRIFSYPLFRVLLWVAVIAVLLLLVWFIAVYPGSEEDRYFTGIAVRILSVLLIAILVTVLLSGWILLYRRSVRRRQLRATRQSTDTFSQTGRMLRRVIRRTTRRPPVSRGWRFIFREPVRVPWYLLLGARRSGKTATVCRSGHYFSPEGEPLAERFHETDKADCHCWLANDAVYVETRGEVISEPETSADKWQGFVRLLKKYRPSKSVQGTIVTVSAIDLLTGDKSSVSELAGVFRTRLAALQQIPGISFPVYVVVTHLDRLKGFEEYFHYLSDAERRQIWGITLPLETRNTSVAEYVHQHLGQLQQRIDAGLNRRLQSEYDVENRRAMYAFPEELQLLCQQTEQFICSLFFVSLYEDLPSRTALRGVYLTSSGQTDRKACNYAPGIISRWHSQFTAVQEAPAQTAETAVPGAQTEDIKGRPYFLQQLFCELIINDQRLAQDTRLTFLRFCRLRWPVYILLLLIISGLLYGMASSFASHSRYLKGVRYQLDLLHQQQDYLQREHSLVTIARLLEGLRGLSQQPDKDSGRIVFVDGEVAKVSEGVYQSALRQLLLPPAEDYARVALEQAVARGDMAILFRQLKIYLMVYGLVPADAVYLANMLAPALLPSEESPDYRSEIDFGPDLLALFSYPLERERGEEADPQLILRARELLARQPRPARIYQQLLQRLSPLSPPAFSLAALSEGAEGKWFVQRTDVPQQNIDGWFTARGYLQFRKQLLLLLSGLDREDWQVMNSSEHGSGAADITETAALSRDVLIRYLDEYTRYWQQMLGSIRISQPQMTGPQSTEAGQQRDLYRLSRLATAGSPLVRLLERLVAETTLLSAESWIPAVAGAVANSTTSQRLTNAGQRGSESLDQLVWLHTDSHFTALRQFVTGREKGFNKNQPSEPGNGLSVLLGQINELQLLFRLNEDPLTSKAPATWPALAAGLQAGSQNWPDPLRNIILPLLDQISLRIRSISVGRNSSGISEGPGAFCRKNLAGRYPFADSKRDVSLADFSRFFAPGGIADNYFRQHLADKVDTTVNPWKFINIPVGDPQHQSLQLFRRAREIRSLFFPRGDSHQPSLSLSLSVQYLSPAINRLELVMGSEKLSYSHGPVRPLNLQWPEGIASRPVTLSLTASQPGDIAVSQWTGPWALFRWLESASALRLQPSGELTAEFNPAGKKVVFSSNGLVSEQQPVMRLLRRFSCR